MIIEGRGEYISPTIFDLPRPGPPYFFKETLTIYLSLLFEDMRSKINHPLNKCPNISVYFLNI